MKRTRYTEEKIISILKEHDTGANRFGLLDGYTLRQVAWLINIRTS